MLAHYQNVATFAENLTTPVPSLSECEGRIENVISFNIYGYTEY